MKVSDLIKLGSKAIKLFEQHIADNSIKPPIRHYVRHFVTDLEISETNYSSRGSSEIVEKPDWIKIAFDFMNKQVEPLPEFKELSQSIAKRYKSNIQALAKNCNEVSQSSFWLSTFILKLIYAKLENRLSEDYLVELASLFKSELELSPTEYKYVHYLDGIFLEANSIQINDNVLVRKTQKSDLEYTKDIFDTSGPNYIGLPKSILEAEIFAENERDCYEYVNGIFSAMRLYKLGSIYSIESRWTKKSAIWPGLSGRSGGHRNYSVFRTYTVRDSEKNSFVNFLNIIQQKLNFDRKEEKEYRTLYISIERYNSALMEAVDIDRKLMTAVMGLESLFTLEKDRGENAFKLGIRVAKILSNSSFDAEKVRALIEEAYGFRNMVVHGSYLPEIKRQRMNEIFPEILNYLRVSLIIFLLTQEIGKNKMIEMIDKSMISDSKNEALKNTIGKNMKGFEDLCS